MKILSPQNDTTDLEVAKLRQKIDRKEKQAELAQLRFERTTTYYIGRAAGVIK